MNVPTFAPTVLVFDDDPAVLELARSRFYAYTSLGVVTAESLNEARRLIDERRIRFHAIVSDISVVPAKQDVEHGLQSGIDLLEYAAKQRPDISSYVLSVWAESPKYKDQSEERGLKILRWFQKLAPVKDEVDKEAFWNFIERELYAAKLGIVISDSEPDSIPETVRTRLHPITRTYLQSLPDAFEIVTPIEVLCRNDEGSWLADAPSLGLLQPGVGETLEDALENLGELVVEQYQTFDRAEENEISGYAENIFKIFKEHVKYRSK
jgi:hypothetical protein